MPVNVWPWPTAELTVVFLVCDPEQSSVLRCYDQLGSVLELSLPSRFQSSVCRSGTHTSEISNTPATDIQEVVWTPVTRSRTTPPSCQGRLEWIANLATERICTESKMCFQCKNLLNGKGCFNVDWSYCCWKNDWDLLLIVSGSCC